MLKSIFVIFQPNVQWFSQVVRLDARNGMYDYLRGRVRLSPGANSYTVHGVDFNTALPLSTPPAVDDLGVGRRRGEVDFAFLLFEHMAHLDRVELPNLDAIVRPEDVDVKIPPELWATLPQ